MKKPFKFTPKNLEKNIHKLGPWSAYGLAGESLMHYFPDEYDDNCYCELDRELELMVELKCNTWQDAILKYHKEVGYTKEQLHNDECVNEH